MPRVFSVDEFDRRARELVEAVGGGGETVVIQVDQEPLAEAPQRLRLLSLTVSSSTGLPATAEVTLELGQGQGPAMRREHGDGPLDAAFNAIEKLTGLRAEVENFSVIAATKGRDAMA